MTIQQLSQARRLAREINVTSARIRRLEIAATDISSHLSGMPGGGRVSDRTAIGGQIAELRAQMTAALQEYVDAYAQIYEYIRAVPDSYIRQLLSARYLDGYSWRKTAIAVGGGNSESGIKSAVYRYVKDDRK